MRAKLTGLLVALVLAVSFVSTAGAAETTYTFIGYGVHKGVTYVIYWVCDGSACNMEAYPLVDV